MRGEVIGFKALSGNHGGENLGRYAVGLLDRVGVMDKDRSKVLKTITYLISIAYLVSMITSLCQLFTATLDNTSNNNTTCQEIEDIHARRGLPRWDSSEKQLPYVALSLCYLLGQI